MLNNNSRLCRNTNVRSVLFSVLGIGISANSILLFFHVLIFIGGHTARLTDLPICLLSLTELLMLITMGLLAVDMFVSQGDWDAITCKSLIYLHRILRGLSLCAICMLSVIQAVILSPRTSCLAKFKHKSPHQNLQFFLFLCIFYMSISSHLFISIIATPQYNLRKLYVCHSILLSSRYEIFHKAHVFHTAGLQGSLPTGLMTLSSAYMVTVLCRHRKQSQHLRSTSLSAAASPEQRATGVILLLMGFFAFQYILDTVILYSRTKLKHDAVFYCVQLLVSHSYATVSPFVFISTEKRIIRLLTFMCGMTANT